MEPKDFPSYRKFWNFCLKIDCSGPFRHACLKLTMPHPVLNQFLA